MESCRRSLRSNADGDAAQDAEAAVCDQALLRLRDAETVCRQVFADLPDWSRGPISRAYRSGWITGHGGEHEWKLEELEAAAEEADEPGA